MVQDLDEASLRALTARARTELQRQIEAIQGLARHRVRVVVARGEPLSGDVQFNALTVAISLMLRWRDTYYALDRREG